MEETIKQYKKVIKNVEADIVEAEKFKEDLMKIYSTVIDLDDTIKIQSMVLKIADLISNKRINKVELERQLRELETTQ